MPDLGQLARGRNPVELLLEWVLKAARAGTSRWIFGSTEFEWDRREREIFGFAEDDRVSIDDLMARVHPDDRKGIYERMEKAILPGEHDDWNHESIRSASRLPALASPQTEDCDGGAHGGSLMSEKPSALPFASPGSDQAKR